jgi:hypothetical protein
MAMFILYNVYCIFTKGYLRNKCNTSIDNIHFISYSVYCIFTQGYMRNKYLIYPLTAFILFQLVCILSQVRDKWRALVNAVKNLRVPQNAGKLHRVA